MSPLRVDVLVGARPNLPKAAALFRAAVGRAIALRLVHTGQHSHPDLASAFARDLGLPAPHVQLLATGEGDARLHGMVAAYRACLAVDPPDAVLVVGDVDSTLAGARAAQAQGVPVVHVEAGLRCDQPAMREEQNRREVDRIAARLYSPSPIATEQLLAEGRSPSDVVEAGNVMVDIALAGPGRRPQLPVDLEAAFAVVTLHRPELLDTPDALESVGAALRRLAARIPLVFPVHPRAEEHVARWPATPRLHLLPPLVYSEFSWLLRHARLVITDSGGVQEEAACLGIRCVTVRPSTERPITLQAGNTLVGYDGLALERACVAALEAAPLAGQRLPGWDGRAAERILDDLVSWLPSYQAISTPSR